MPIILCVFVLCFKPVLKRYQGQNQPEFKHRKNREQLLSAGWTPAASPSVGADWISTSLERPSSSVIRLPELPDHVKDKQVRFGTERERERERGRERGCLMSVICVVGDEVIALCFRSCLY